MSDVKDSDIGKAAAPEPTPPQLGEAGEHPLSVLLFSWMRTRAFYRGLMAVLAALCVALMALDVVAPRKGYLPLEGLPGFFGVFALIAFVIVVLAAWPLGKLLRRPEDYYEREAGHDD